MNSSLRLHPNGGRESLKGRPVCRGGEGVVEALLGLAFKYKTSTSEHGLRPLNSPGGLVIAVLATLLFVGCKDGVPTTTQLKKHGSVQPFLQKPTSIRGVYYNIDVDSVVFAYRTKCDSQTTFWYSLNKDLVKAGWHQVDSNGTFRAFGRMEPKGNRAVCSAEETRVAYLEKSRAVVVAWVQGDSKTNVTSFSELDTEARFANGKIWPMFLETHGAIETSGTNYFSK